jgi:transposase-like protein
MARAGTLQRKSLPRRSPAEKRSIVELALREGASARSVASAHGVSRQSLRNWMALYLCAVTETGPASVTKTPSPE